MAAEFKRLEKSLPVKLKTHLDANQLSGLFEERSDLRRVPGGPLDATEALVMQRCTCMNHRTKNLSFGHNMSA